MADKNLYNSKDSLEISELASLNEDISNDLLEQLQQKVMEDAVSFSDNGSLAPDINDDSTLFEEPGSVEPKNSQALQSSSDSTEKKDSYKLDTSFDDNFIKKYKAKLSKQAKQSAGSESSSDVDTNEKSDNSEAQDAKNEPIEKISNGNIKERIITQEQKEYNDSLDFLDNNVKYSKYVIYIDPQNVDFIESLTVKERKNLINNVLKQQNDISINKQRFKVVQNMILHVIIAVLTVAISIPIVYHAINASLEASIDNYRRSQTNFQTLYKEKGKITNTNR